jgi:two-component system phosphate regulon response regulator PhoB
MPLVLVADDDRDIRELLAFRLERAGHEVHGEPDGERGLAAARRLRPALVILDWMMPRMDGLEVCRRLRDDPATRSIPVVIMTGRDDIFRAVRERAVAADAYLEKPILRDRLLRVASSLTGPAAAAAPLAGPPAAASTRR